MKRPFKSPTTRPHWNYALAEKLHGSTVLVGLTINEPDRPRQQQFYGTVMSAGPEEGVVLRLEGRRSGEVYTLPPDLEAFLPAEPGSYELRETGELVVDPDYTATWSITPPRH
jgi:hypothetical protein